MAIHDQRLRRVTRLLERLPTERPPPELRAPLQARLDEHAARYVYPVTGFLFLFNALLVPVNLFWPGMGEGREVIAAIALGSTALFGILWLVVRRTGVRPAAAHPVLLAMALVPLGGSLTQLWISGDPIHTTNVMLVVLASGALFLQLRWFAWVLILAVYGWVCVALLVADAADPWLHFGIGMILASGAAVTVYVLHREGLKGLELLNLRLSDLASLDGLTGIANRRAFDARLDSEWAAHRAEGGSLSLLICDLDYFKNLNDTRGHGAGDVALRQTAGVLRATARSEEDLPARLGGEEFSILLPRTTAEHAMLVAERVRKGLCALNIPNPGIGPDEIMTMSVGVATLLPEEGGFPVRLLTLADEALYEAKRSGRNRSVSRSGPNTAPGASVGPGPGKGPDPSSGTVRRTGTGVT